MWYTKDDHQNISLSAGKILSEFDQYQNLRGILLLIFNSNLSLKSSYHLLNQNNKTRLLVNGSADVFVTTMQLFFYI
jgi:hypothetical protein